MLIFVLIIYTLVTVVYTYPVAFRLFDTVFGFSGDNFGLIWSLWWQNFASRNGLSISPTPFFNAPVGEVVTALSGEVGWALPMRYLAKFVGEIPSFNLFILVSFPLSGLFMFLLTDYLFRNRYASFLAGLTYMISPFHFWQGYTHLSLALIQWLPLFVLSLFYLDRERSWKASLFLSFSFLLVFLNSFYLGFFSALIGVLFFFFRIIFDFRGYLNLRAVMLLLVTLAIVTVGVLPVVVDFRSARIKNDNSGTNRVFSRQVVELLGLSSRPWDYLIYPPNHPFFGKYNKPIYDFIQSLSSDFKFRSTYLPERVVFIGLLNTLLVLIGIALLRSGNSDLRTIFFLFASSLIISLPPYFNIRGLTFYTPSHFIFNFFPLVRVYSRMGIYVYLFVVLIAAFVVKRFSEKMKSKGLWHISYSLLVAVTLFEFLPGSGYTDFGKVPVVYNWLRNQTGDFMILEYPKAFDLQSALFFQRYHQKRIFNMPDNNPRYEFWRDLEFLTNPNAHDLLKRYGVRYVIYHLVDLTVNPYDDWRFFRFAKSPVQDEEKFYSDIGLVRVKEFPEAIVYEVK